ncbi:hypothetical protein L3X66_26890, partial [Vibrio harveyi]|nr:hypothetical protein [Vibrio harveyi]
SMRQGCIKLYGFRENAPISICPHKKWVNGKFSEVKLGRVDLCCTFRVQQYIGNHINMNASDNMLA